MWTDHLEGGKLWWGLRAHYGVDMFKGLEDKQKQPNRKQYAAENYVACKAWSIYQVAQPIT